MLCSGQCRARCVVRDAISGSVMGLCRSHISWRVVLCSNRCSCEDMVLLPSSIPLQSDFLQNLFPLFHALILQQLVIQ